VERPQRSEDERTLGTPCSHEHACIRCPMLQVNTKVLPRLDELETGLLDRRSRAEQEGWLGEIDGLDLTLNLVRQQRGETRRMLRRSTDLGMPRLMT
jgi:hypothetical protein